jgi:hypothetical protein
MYASVGYTLFLMALVTLFNTVYIPYFIKEHQVPLIFRNPDSSLFFDTQRAKNLFYMIFLVLSGILASLNFYDTASPCLHTYSEAAISTEYVDLYQYSMTALLWIVSLPMIILAVMVAMGDNLRFGCYPFIIANMIFSFMLFLLSQIVIILAIIYTKNFYFWLLHIVKYGILGVSLFFNFIYRVCFARYDITKEDHQEEEGALETKQEHELGEGSPTMNI